MQLFSQQHLVAVVVRLQQGAAGVEHHVGDGRAAAVQVQRARQALVRLRVALSGAERIPSLVALERLDCEAQHLLEVLVQQRHALFTSCPPPSRRLPPP